MATLLTTDRMNPALAARVEKSVRGGRARRPALRRAVALGRVAAVVGLVLATYLFISGWQRDQGETERARAALLQRVEERARGLSTADLGAVARAEDWIDQIAGEAYVGDVTAPELQAAGALSQLFARPMIYVRGPAGGFDGPDEIAATSATSPKDALLYCLREPPSSRAEQAVLESVRVVYFDPAITEERTASARPLHELLVGLPFLQARWSDRVRAAKDTGELARLGAAFERAPIERAVAAASAQLLLVAVDEPGDGKGPVEIDGARPHFVRVALVDLAESKILLSLRQRLDPSWISEERRTIFASGLDSCALGFDIRRRFP